MTITASSGIFLLLSKVSSILSEIVEPRRVGDQDLAAGGFVGNAVVQQTKQVLEIGHRLGAVADMGPSAAPHDLVGRSLNDGAHEGGRGRIRAADARVAVGTGDLGPVTPGL